MSKTLYYIRGIEDRCEEVINALIEKGAKNSNCCDGDCPEYLYFINGRGEISACDTSDDWNTELLGILINFGVELKLPERPKTLSWNDIEETEGYVLADDDINYTKDGYKYKDTFATEQQAKSVQAVAMISQIRKQGEHLYGPIVPKGEACVMVTSARDQSLCQYDGYVTTYNGSQGGLLRFVTKDQALLFVNNNRELVDTYLKTF